MKKFCLVFSICLIFIAGGAAALPLPPRPGSDGAVNPTPTPSPTISPWGSPSPTPGGLELRWIPSEDFLSIFGPGRGAAAGRGSANNPEKKSVTVTVPGNPPVVYRQREPVDYDPHKNTIAYSLLNELLRSVYGEMFGIYFTTPTPVPAAETPTPTPEGYQTPAPTCTLTPSPTTSVTPTPTPTPTLSPVPTSSTSPVPTFSPSPTPSTAPSAPPTPSPTAPQTFALIDTLYTGQPMWSVFADDNYVYGGSEDGKIYLWSRDTDEFNFQTSLSSPATGKMYSVYARHTATHRYLYGANADHSLYVWDYPLLSSSFSFFSDLNQATNQMHSVWADESSMAGANEDANLYIWNSADFSLQTVISASPDQLLSVYGDEYYFYGAGADGSIYLWNSCDFSFATSFSEGTEIMWSTTADSYYFYGGNQNGQVYVWDKAFAFQTTLPGTSQQIYSVSSDDRAYLYGASDDSDIYTWARGFNTQTNTLTDATGAMNCVFADRYRSGDDLTHYIFGANADGNIYIWLAARTPTPTPTPTVIPSPSPSASPSSTSTVTPSPSVTPTAPPTPSSTPTPEGYETPSPSPSPTAKTGFGEEKVSDFQLITVLTEGTEWMFGVDADERYIYGANEDNNIYVWSREDYRLKKTLREGNNYMVNVHVDKGASGYLYGACLDTRLYLWNKSALYFRTSLGIGFESMEGVYSDNDYIYGASSDNYIYVWRKGDLTLETRLIRPESDWRLPGLMTSVFADRDYIYGGSGGKDSTVFIWNRRDFAFNTALTTPRDDVNAVTSDDNYIYAASADGKIYIWKKSDFSGYKTLSARGAMDCLAVSDSYLYGGSSDGSVFVWDKKSFSPYRRLTTGDEKVLWLCADEEIILAASADSDIYLWKAPSGSASRRSWFPTPTPLPHFVLPSPSSTPRKQTGSSWLPEDFSDGSAAPTPPITVVPDPAVAYNPDKNTIAYPLLQQLYKNVYGELFGILLTTPTPPPTPIPTPTAVATATPVGYKTPSSGGEGDVVINEINWGGVSGDPDKQWIELYNYGDSAVDLNGWSIFNSTQGWTVTIGEDLSIAAGGYFVLVWKGAPSGVTAQYIYSDSTFSMGQIGGDRLELKDSDGTPRDTVGDSASWYAGEQGVSMERISPSASGTSSGNWSDALVGAVYPSGGVDRGTPGAQNSVYNAAAGAGGGVILPSLSLQDYADWIDFPTGDYFKLYEWDLTGRDEKTALFDYLPNTAFIYLATGYQPDAEYFKKNLLALVRDSKFNWGGEETCRYVADIAEAYLAMEGEGIFSRSERKEIEEKFYQIARRGRLYYNQGNYAQGTICGLNAVVGYIIGGEKGAEMIDWANRLLSYNDTWTLPEDSRHFQGLFLRQMLRVALYSNKMTIPDLDAGGVAWKDNFIRQINWIINTAPHNGYCPAYGREYRQNYTDHFLTPLIVATSVLDDGNPEHVLLARNCKWLLQKMYDYGTTHTVGAYGQNAYGYEAEQWGPFAILLNPIYLWWFLNERITPLSPDEIEHGSQVIYRPRLPYDSIAADYDASFKELVKQADKIVLRDGWGEDAFFLMLDPAYPAAQNGPNRYSFANNILSLSYGDEEFLTSLTMNFRNGEKTLLNLADSIKDYSRAKILSWDDNPEFTRCRTRLKDENGSWTRQITLYRQGTPRLEVKDTLSRGGSIYWHLQGEPRWEGNSVILTNGQTRLRVKWAGAGRSVHREWATWSEADPFQRWAYSGDPDQELRLDRYSPGTVTTTFTGLGRLPDQDSVPVSK